MSLLECQKLSVNYGDTSILRDVSLSLEAGEVLGLVGPNGAGKSSWLAALAGLIRPRAGQIRLDGRELHAWSARERAKKLAWLEQNGSVYWPLSVETVVGLGRHAHGQKATHSATEKQIEQSAVYDAMAACDLLHLRERLANTLSGGERSRMLLARALAGQPKVLLVDEPVAALDLKHQLKTMAVLRAEADAGRGVIVVLHDLAHAARWCDRIVMLEQGRVAAAGRPAKVLTAERIGAVYGVDVALKVEPGGVSWVVPTALRSAPD